MSQDYHHQAAAAAAAGIYGFSNGYERSQQEEQIIGHHHQVGRDKVLRGQGFEPPPPLVAIDEGEEETGGGALHGYDQTAGLLSEMFNFPSGAAATATELLQQQISGNYHHGQIIRSSPHHRTHDNWYSTGNEHKSSHLVNEHGNHGIHQQQHIGTSINTTDSAAAAMQLFLMNPSAAAARSPSQSPPSSTLHMLLPNPSPNSTSNSIHHHQAFHSPVAFGPSPHQQQQQFTWVPGNTSHDAGSTSTTAQLTPHHQIIEGHGQGLSLSLSSSLQHLEAAKAEEFRTGGGNGGMLFFNQGGGGGSNTNAQYSFKNLGEHHNNQALQLQGTEVVLGAAQNQQIHQVGFRSSSLGVVNVLRTSKYVKAAQELLEEFCSVGRGQFKKNKFAKPPNSSTNPTGSSGGGASSSSSKDLPPLSASDRIEHQRRKVKLLSMLDEVDRRYSHYCQQMQMVVNSFDLVMGYGAAVPYTALAQKAMSRHFRCLKDAIAAQVKHSCELLGEKDAAGTSGVTKGETPRLKLLEQSLRQQRAFHQMGGGMLEQEAWRPQRGLPERSVNILRAWLFEHFLHPYPSDADKHLLARQTGLSRNQVSNWFINARVRLWKPMVEDMYQQESKDEGEDDMETNAQTPMHSTTIASTTTTFTSTAPSAIRSEMNAPESDPSSLAINTHFSENQPPNHLYSSSTTPHSTPACRRGTTTGNADDHSNNIGSSTLISFGANTTGDVSLTLGLRHVGNMPEKNPFGVRDFGGC